MHTQIQHDEDKPCQRLQLRPSALLIPDYTHHANTHPRPNPHADPAGRGQAAQDRGVHEAQPGACGRSGECVGACVKFACLGGDATDLHLLDGEVKGSRGATWCRRTQWWGHWVTAQLVDLLMGVLSHRRAAADPLRWQRCRWPSFIPCAPHCVFMGATHRCTHSWHDLHALELGVVGTSPYCAGVVYATALCLNTHPRTTCSLPLPPLLLIHSWRRAAPPPSARAWRARCTAGASSRSTETTRCGLTGSVGARVADAVREVGHISLKQSQADTDTSRVTGCSKQVSECGSAVEIA